MFLLILSKCLYLSIITCGFVIARLAACGAKMHVMKCFRIFTLLANSYPTKTNQNNHTWKFRFHLLPSSISFY